MEGSREKKRGALGRKIRTMQHGVTMNLVGAVYQSRGKERGILMMNRTGGKPSMHGNSISLTEDLGVADGEMIKTMLGVGEDDLDAKGEEMLSRS